MPKIIWQGFENLKLAVKQCYQTGQFLIGQKWVENAKIQNATFWVIFKQCEYLENWFCNGPLHQVSYLVNYATNVEVAKKPRNHIYCAILLVLRLEFEFKTKMKIVFVCLILMLGQDLIYTARRLSLCSDGHVWCTLAPRKQGECCPIGKCQIG